MAPLLAGTALALGGTAASGGGVLPRPPEGAPAILPVAVVSYVGLAAPTRAMLESEARAVLGPLGTQLRWRRLGPGGEIGAEEVPVLLLAGEHPVAGRAGAVLGGVEPRAERPAAWIYVRAVERAIGLARHPGPEDSAGLRALGVALGRVVAHELVHAMAPTKAHGTAGFMRASWDRESLIGARPRLDAASDAAFRAGVRRFASNASDAARGRDGPSTGPEPADPRARQWFLYGTPGRDSR